MGSKSKCFDDGGHHLVQVGELVSCGLLGEDLRLFDELVLEGLFDLPIVCEDPVVALPSAVFDDLGNLVPYQFVVSMFHGSYLFYSNMFISIVYDFNLKVTLNLSLNLTEGGIWRLFF